MKKFLFFLFLIAAHAGRAQKDIAKLNDSIVAEGKMLYRSEMASWYGTDIFLEKFRDRRINMGGYLSYEDSGRVKCIFFSKDERQNVLVTISFDSTYSTSTAQIDPQRRDFTPYERSLYLIRQAALEDISTDTITYKKYKDTNYNLIPVNYHGRKKVYILTGPKSGGLLVIGNDYLLTFDESDHLESKKLLHKNVMFFNYGEKDKDGQVVIGAAHTHLPETGDLITVTDVCTLMLYEKFAQWKQHLVISAHYVSIWNCETNSLTTLSKDDWEKRSKKVKNNQP